MDAPKLVFSIESVKTVYAWQYSVSSGVRRLVLMHAIGTWKDVSFSKLVRLSFESSFRIFPSRLCALIIETTNGGTKGLFSTKIT